MRVLKWIPIEYFTKSWNIIQILRDDCTKDFLLRIPYTWTYPELTGYFLIDFMLFGKKICLESCVIIHVNGSVESDLFRVISIGLLNSLLSYFRLYRLIWLYTGDSGIHGMKNLIWNDKPVIRQIYTHILPCDISNYGISATILNSKTDIQFVEIIITLLNFANEATFKMESGLS